MDFIPVDITFWHWWILAALLFLLDILILELGTFFLWLAIAAMGVGGALYFFPTMRVEYQILLFSVSSIAIVIVGRSLLHRYSAMSDHPTLNRRGSEFINQTFTLTTPIIDGIGRVKAGDNSWLVEGVDCPVGTKIKVVGVNGTRLQIEPIP
jgi:hypothetical protein